MGESNSLSFADAAAMILTEAGAPLHVAEITARALKSKLVQTAGKTPAATMEAILAVKAKEPGSLFVRTAPRTYGLSEWKHWAKNPIRPADEVADERVRTPHYPTQEEIRHAIPAWAGLRRDAITGMRAAIYKQAGTVSENVDWTDPDTWIDQRLQGEARKVARRTWEKSNKTVNPRHAVGVWLLISNYELLSDANTEVLEVSPSGRDFLAHEGGETARQIDETEGVLWLLRAVVERGHAARGDLLPLWREYLQQHGRIRSDTSAKSYLWSRLRNLVGRGFVRKSGTSYEPTEAGIAYLGAPGVSAPGVVDEDGTLHQLIRDRHESVRDQLRELLQSMDPYAFEYVIKDLLEAMGYEDVVVTARSGDKGVDVIGRIELGITSVREVVQAKRHAKNIQRSVLDALRGSLHRFEAVRGSIITTGDFARGTNTAAFESGAAPITLINGEKLIDLLIKNEIGIKKREVEIWDVDLDAFQTDAEEGNDHA
jgi:restriction system protein